MRVEDYVIATRVIRLVVTLVCAFAGSLAWSPYPLGYVIEAAIGVGASYVVLETLDRVYLSFGDRERIRRELAEIRRRREERRRGR